MGKHSAQPHFEPERIGYAKTQLDDAIDQLAGTRRTTIRTDDGTTRTHVLASRYQEIRDSIAGRQGTDNRNAARSMPPIWVDAADWLNTVDTTVRSWIGDEGNATTPDRLYTLTERGWRPDDLRVVTMLTEVIVRWTTQADALLDPDAHRSLELTAPCPACATRTVHRRDSAGEWVRQAALTVTEHGCMCLACRAKWGPEHFQWLARVIGCDLPAGVLE